MAGEGINCSSALPTARLLALLHWARGRRARLPPAADSLILSFSDWQTGKINPHPETAAKTTATTAILSASCKGGERPGGEKTRGAGSQATGRTSMDGPGGPRGSSITGTGSIYLPAGGQMGAFCRRLWSMQCPTWEVCCPPASLPTRVLLTITLAKGHHLGDLLQEGRANLPLPTLPRTGPRAIGEQAEPLVTLRWGAEAEGWGETTQGSPGKGGEQGERWGARPQQPSPAMVMFSEVSCQLISLLALQE